MNGSMMSPALASLFLVMMQHINIKCRLNCHIKGTSLKYSK